MQGSYRQLEGTAHYAGLVLAPAEDFDLRPKLELWESIKKSPTIKKFTHNSRHLKLQEVPKDPRGT